MVVPLVGWPIFIAMLLILFLISGWVTALFDHLARPYLNRDVLAIGSILTFALLPCLFLGWMRLVFSRKSEEKRSMPIQGLVRIHENGDVSFLSEGTTVRRAIERVFSSDAFLFMSIEEGRRFVFVPRARVGRDDPAAIAAFVSSRLSTGE